VTSRGFGAQPVAGRSARCQRDAACRRYSSLLAAVVVGAGLLLSSPVLRAQDTPKFVIDEDCQVFDIAANNTIVYAVPRIKRVKRLMIERDDISIATGPGKTRRIVEADKFMPIPPPAGYAINSLAWSPDGQRIAVNMTLQQPPPGYEPPTGKNKDKDRENDREEDAPTVSVGGGKAIALLDIDGREIRVAGSKTRFIEDATNAMWLADSATVVYLKGAPFQIVRVRPSDGNTSTLFEGHGFDAVLWDAPRSRAFAVGENLSVGGGLALVELDLLRETVTQIARIEAYQGALSLSPSGTKIAFFADGDTIEVIDIANPSKPLRVRAGFGTFQWSRDERRVLLKRGPEERSNILVWVGLYDGSFVPVLHDLEFRAFEIAPDGQSIAVTVPGKRVLKVYPLQ
jgi:dipeptidyl aminopeptidase/acylaminoacyl peptidase